MKFKAAQKKAVAKFDNPDFVENIRDEDPTMVKHLDILKEINECGLLTTNSQAGRKTPTIYERSYITGFMLKKDAIKFIKHMSIETDKVIISPSWTMFADPKLDIPLTIEKNKKDRWEVFTHMSTSIPGTFLCKERKQLELDQKRRDTNIIYIFCFDPKWNRNASSKNGLFTDVLKVLKILKSI
jgi:hypothetical protein